MKIHQLPPGARFKYEGEEYVKSGPLLATGKGGQRLIPKYAVLKVLGDGGAVPVQQRDALARDAVLAALEKFSATCARLVPEDRHGELETARAEFLKALD
jgi:hypothetical protein